MSWAYNPFTNKLDKISKEDLSGYLTDAPSDGTMYGRRDGEWEAITLLPPVYDWWDPTGGLPTDPDDGDRYAADGDGSGWEDGHIYEWDESADEWVDTGEPEEGWMFWMLFELIFYVFFSGGWMEVGSGSYWHVDNDQILLTGDKSGSFNLTTTGTVKIGTFLGGGALDLSTLYDNVDMNAGYGFDWGAGSFGTYGMKIIGNKNAGLESYSDGYFTYQKYALDGSGVPSSGFLNYCGPSWTAGDILLGSIGAIFTEDLGGGHCIINYHYDALQLRFSGTDYYIKITDDIDLVDNDLTTTGTVTAGDVSIGSAYQIATASDRLYFTGTKVGGANENIYFDLDTTSNFCSVGSTTGATTFYYNMSINFIDDLNMAWGTGYDATLSWRTLNGLDHLELGIKCGTDAQSGYFNILNRNDTGLLARAPASFSVDPVLRIYSSDVASATDYIEFFHNQTDAYIQSGTGTINFNDDNLTTVGTVTIGDGTTGVLDLTGLTADVNLFSDKDQNGLGAGESFTVTRHDTSFGNDTSVEIYCDEYGNTGFAATPLAGWGSLVFYTNNDRPIWFNTGNILSLGAGSNPEGSHPRLQHYGYPTGSGWGGAKYVQWDMDTTKYFTLTREDTNILGLDIQMPTILDDTTVEGTLDLTGLTADVNLFQDEDIAGASEGHSLYVHRHSTDDATDINLRIFVNDAGVGTIVSNGYLWLGAGTTSSPIWIYGSPFNIGQYTNTNPAFRLFGYLTGGGGPYEKYSQLQVVDNTDGSGTLALTNEDANINGFDIQMPLVTDGIYDDAATSLLSIDPNLRVLHPALGGLYYALNWSDHENIKIGDEDSIGGTKLTFIGKFGIDPQSGYIHYCPGDYEGFIFEHPILDNITDTLRSILPDDRQLWDSTNEAVSLDWENKILYSAPGGTYSTRIDWSDTDSITVYGQGSLNLNDGAGSGGIGRVGFTAGGELSIESNSYIVLLPSGEFDRGIWIADDGSKTCFINFNTGSPSLDPNNRILYDATGLVARFDWENLTINEVYTLPSTDGNDGDVLTTDGAGAVAWEAGGGALPSYVAVMEKNMAITGFRLAKANSLENYTLIEGMLDALMTEDGLDTVSNVNELYTIGAYANCVPDGGI